MTNRDAAQRNTGISNRESAREESAERAAHPPVDTSAPPPEDAAGRAELLALVPRTRLAVKLGKNDLVRRIRPRPPVDAVRRAENDDRGRVYGRRDVSDAGVVSDKNGGF